MHHWLIFIINSFWLVLLRNVLGVTEPGKFFAFEDEEEQ